MKFEGPLLAVKGESSGRVGSFARVAKAAIAVMAMLWAAAAPTALGAPAPASTFASGDYVLSQESPQARQQEQSRSAGSFIFHLTRTGQIDVMSKPPQITAPRGIRALGGDRFVFADALGGAIRIVTAWGAITTLHSGAPLTEPKDVAADRGGGYVIADFDTFKANAHGSIFKLTDAGKITTVASGPPLRWPHGIDVDAGGNYIVADHSGSVFRVSPQGKVTTVATGAPLVAPTDVKVDKDGNYIVTDIGIVLDENGRMDLEKSRHPGTLFKITSDGQVSTIARRPMARFRAVALHPDGGYVVVDFNSALYRIMADGNITVLFQGPPLHQPSGIAIVP
jgi:sugar lactone lactonase YvrE